MQNKTYVINFNPTTQTWCLFKQLESEHSYNFYPIWESTNKKECQEKLKNITKSIDKSKHKKYTKGNIKEKKNE